MVVSEYVYLLLLAFYDSSFTTQLTSLAIALAYLCTVAIRLRSCLLLLEQHVLSHLASLAITFSTHKSILHQSGINQRASVNVSAKEGTP